MRAREPGMAYDMGRLNRLFALLSFLLLVSTLWMFLDDYIRPWKAVQLEARQVEKRRLTSLIEAEDEAIDQEALAALEARLAEARETVARRSEAVGRTRGEIREIQRAIATETIYNGRMNALSSDENFRYESAVGSGERASVVRTLLASLQATKRRFALSRERLKDLQAKLGEKNGELAALLEEETSARREIDGALRSRSLLALERERMETDAVFFLRNAPFVDFMDPTLRVRQVVVGDLLDDRYFQHVPKVDRCMTCHTFIDRPGFENEPNPHRTHPNLDLMVGAESRHPMKSFGCTACHGGEGHRVNDFNAAAHTPQNEEQKAEWVEKYGWREPHKIPEPMHKLQYTESQCLKCHQGVEYVPRADKLNEGIRTMEKYGCYACHRIEGWEHKRTPGPSLERIASKVGKEFFKNWVWSPKVFNEHATMPSFFMQSNNSDEESVKRNIAEVNAIAEYVWEKSEPYAPPEKFEGGDAARGKRLVETVGCMGCHGVQGREADSRRVGAFAGPWLANTGSKVASADWLFSWLRRPSHYDPGTIMPSFRLTEQEAGDITAHLMGLRDPRFEELRFAEADPGARDALLVEYLAAFETEEAARGKVAAMGERERDLELGRRSIGKYGCYSCHAIDGFQDRSVGIGPELTAVGSKPLTQFGFNLQHGVEHSRDGWIKAHLMDPRRWDGGLDRAFKDLSRMPGLEPTEREAESMTLVLLGLVDQRIPLAGRKRLDEHERLWARGERLVNKFNCYGCHRIDGVGGDVLAMYGDDVNEGPPRLVRQGARVRSDWLYHFLDDVVPIRPWLSVRMPSFVLSPEERNAIVAGFQAKDRKETFVETDAGANPALAWDSPEERAEAGRLFDRLACVSCHSQGYTNEEPLAPDLRDTAAKLRPEWTRSWLLDPQATYQETTMPSFWQDGEPLEPDFFGGDTDRQLDALVKHLYNLGGGGTRGR